MICMMSIFTAVPGNGSSFSSGSTPPPGPMALVPSHTFNIVFQASGRRCITATEKITPLANPLTTKLMKNCIDFFQLLECFTRAS